MIIQNSFILSLKFKQIVGTTKINKLRLHIQNTLLLNSIIKCNFIQHLSIRIRENKKITLNNKKITKLVTLNKLKFKYYIKEIIIYNNIVIYY